MGLLLGIAGVGLLVGEETLMGQRAIVIGSIAILLGTLAWSFGVMYSLKAPLPRNAMARAGMPEIIGSLILLALRALPANTPSFHPADRHPRSWWSLVYLITFGSIITFTAYTWLLRPRFAHAGFDPHLRKPCDCSIYRLAMGRRGRQLERGRGRTSDPAGRLPDQPRHPEISPGRTDGGRGRGPVSFASSLANR